jgi:hypothetical protein
MHAIRVCRTRGELLVEVGVLVDAGSVAGGRGALGGKGGVEAEHLDGLKYGEREKLKAAPLEFCYFGVCPSINDHIGHDVVCLEIVKRDDHPAGRGGGRRRDRCERGDG